MRPRSGVSHWTMRLVSVSGRVRRMRPVVDSEFRVVIGKQCSVLSWERRTRLGVLGAGWFQFQVCNLEFVFHRAEQTVFFARKKMKREENRLLRALETKFQIASLNLKATRAKLRTEH